MFQKYKKSLDKLKSLGFKSEIIATSEEEFTKNDITFDDKWWIFAFNNTVYDLKDLKFRDHKYDDYTCTTTGYDWVKPTNDELNLIKKIINEIMQDKDEQELYLQILSTCLEGRCLEHFIIFAGNGRNGKGLINDLLLKTLGSYGMICNNAILFETNKTGANPEKAKMNKKRLTLFREPDERNKFQNSVIKELTGGGGFSSRECNSNQTEQVLNNTMIIECNNRPKLAQEPTVADVNRIIDNHFKSHFTENESDVDHEKRIYKVNLEYKNLEFQSKHKFALFGILVEHYFIYKSNNYILPIPQSVKDRTNNYLELSCNILQWFKESYVKTESNNDFVKIADMFDNFKMSEFYFNLSKDEKRKYNKSYFVNYISTNSYFKKFYKDDFKITVNKVQMHARNVIVNFKILPNNNE
jgi:phage/plasmid-associated DNA primase